MTIETQKLWKDWRVHATVFAIVLLSETIGTHEIPLGPGVILLLPMLYAVIIGISLFFTPLVKEKQSKSAESLVFISVTLLIAKFGVQAGPALPLLIEAGPALLLQENRKSRHHFGGPSSRSFTRIETRIYRNDTLYWT